MKKIVWICSFTDKFIQESIQPRKTSRENSTWISRLAKLFENDTEFEIYIISPHEYIGRKKTFSNKNIHFCFFNPLLPIIGRHWPGFFRMDRWTNYFWNKRVVRKYVNKINPDLIHLHGAEQAQYSATIFQFKKTYPTLITIQGFIFDRLKNNKTIQKRIKVENEILSSFSNFGYRTKEMGRVIQEINPNANLYWHHYPVSTIKFEATEKKYDLVFFARISIEKGIEDLLQALAIIKKEKSDVSLLVLGPTTNKYLQHLKEIAKELNLEDNIRWGGFQETQKDLHDLAQQARISILPTYYDIISGTIIESMFLKLCVVAYDVGSIHELNEEGECIKLVEKANIEKLAENILSLLKNPDEINRLSEKAYLRIHEILDNAKAVEDLKTAYKKILSKNT
jgi:glycosyltransferase involved in cell wall biosynthesis